MHCNERVVAIAWPLVCARDSDTWEKTAQLGVEGNAAVRLGMDLTLNPFTLKTSTKVSRLLSV